MSVLRHPSQWLMLASDVQVDTPGEPEVLNIEELTAAEIKTFHEAGELSSEEIYAAESKADKPRQGVLKAYAPKDEDDKGTTAEVSKDLG